MMSLRRSRIGRFGASLAGLALGVQLLIASWGLVLLAPADPADPFSEHALCLAGDDGKATPSRPAQPAPAHVHDGLCCLGHVPPGLQPSAAVGAAAGRLYRDRGRFCCRRCLYPRREPSTRQCPRPADPSLTSLTRRRPTSFGSPARLTYLRLGEEFHVHPTFRSAGGIAAGRRACFDRHRPCRRAWLCRRPVFPGDPVDRRSVRRRRAVVAHLYPRPDRRRRQPDPRLRFRHLEAADPRDRHHPLAGLAAPESPRRAGGDRA